MTRNIHERIMHYCESCITPIYLLRRLHRLTCWQVAVPSSKWSKLRKVLSLHHCRCAHVVAVVWKRGGRRGKLIVSHQCSLLFVYIFIIMYNNVILLCSTQAICVKCLLLFTCVGDLRTCVCVQLFSPAPTVATTGPAKVQIEQAPKAVGTVT